MIAQEAINIMQAKQNCIQRNIEGKCDRNCKKCSLLQDDAAVITAFDHAITALEKQAPKGAIISTWFGRQCPECRCSVDEDDDYCPYCGQRLTDKEKTDAED